MVKMYNIGLQEIMIMLLQLHKYSHAVQHYGEEVGKYCLFYFLVASIAHLGHQSFTALNLCLLLLNIENCNGEANYDTTKDDTKEAKESEKEATWKNGDAKDSCWFISTWIETVQCQGDAGRQDPGEDDSQGHLL